METAVATNPHAPARNGEYVDIDGLRTYYEVTGTGDPLLLLHGGMCTAETFDAQVPALAERYRVYVPERQGHGRTADVDRPITYESMVNHTISFIEALGLESAHVAGWSDGAIVGLLVALRRPKLVRKLVFLEQYVTLAGAPPAYLPMIQGMTVDTIPPMLTEAYVALSPDGPGHLPVVFEKLLKLWTGETGVDISDLTNVAAPTLLLFADGGGATLEHLAAARGALPDSQLAIVPGASHAVPWEKPHVVNQLILDFLADEQVEKLLALD